MYFKTINANPFRDFLFYSFKIMNKNFTDEEKATELRNLLKFIKPKLLENEALLNSNPAFAKRCAHWNQRDIPSIKPMKNEKNPWLRFKREFEKAVTLDTAEALRAIGIALTWFNYEKYSADWINE